MPDAPAPDPADLLRQLCRGPVTPSSLPFVAGPVVDDPLEPPVNGAAAWSRYALAKYRWLAERGARVESVALTQTAQRIVSEVAILMKHEGKPLALPVAIVADLSRPKAAPAAHRDKRLGSNTVWGAVRMYHSLWPLLGSHRVRAPMVPVDPALKMGNPIGQYHAALRTGDLGGILSVFEAQGYAREPSGGPDGFFRGLDGLRAFYSDLFQSGAGIHLEYCTFTDDGVRGALEYQCVAWGRTRVPPQAGVAVYERGKSGKLSAARIYDDIAPAA